MRVAPTAMALIFVAALGGCVTTPAPTAQLAVANAAVQHANTSSTSQDAPAELQIAIAKLASAQQAETNATTNGPFSLHRKPRSTPRSPN